MRPLPPWWAQRSPGPLLPEHKYPQRLCAPERGTFRFDPTEHERARPVPITYYLPKGYDAKRAAPYPLLIQLHGRGSSNKAMENLMGGLLDQAIEKGLIPPMVSVMPSTGR